MEISTAFGKVSNPWPGGFESVGKWVRKQCKRDKYLYLVHHGLKDIRFHGGGSQIKTLVHSFLAAGLGKQIEDHTPGFWDQEFQFEQGESVQQAPERLFKETYTS